MVENISPNEPFWWMINGQIEEKVSLMTGLKESLDNLPETALTFSPYSKNSHVETFAADGHHTFVDKTILYFGLWPVPDYQKTSSRKRRYVNPEHPDSFLYADSYAECECGTLLVHEHERHVERDGFNEHTEDCQVEWELDARSRLWAKRREVIMESALNFIPLRTVAKRLGVSERSAVYSLNNRLDIDYQELTEIATRKRWLTWAHLRDEGIRNVDIASAFGVASNTVSGAVGKIEYTRLDANESVSADD